MDERTASHRTQGGDLESSLADLEAHLGVADRALKQATGALRNALDAARKGRLRELPKLLAAVGETARGFADRAVEAERSWSFPVETHLSSHEYLAEVQRLADDSGLGNVRVVDGQLFSYPLIVKVDARDVSLKLGKKVHRELRPSHLVRRLQEARSHPVKENLGPVLQMIEKAYLRITHGETGKAVPISDVHELLTLLPGTDKQYTQLDFVADIYRLDRNGPHVTTSGRRLDLPASTSARGGRGTRFITESGEEKLYSSIRFTEVAK
jgi:hypothetical protein